MKIINIKILILFLSIVLLISTNGFAATYPGTLPKDLDRTTPTEGNSPPSEMNDADREIKTILQNQYAITSVTGTSTLTGTQTYIVGSNTAGFTLTFPSASSVASGTVTKEFTIHNINIGTITLNITLDGTGSPTVSRYGTRVIFTDGTSWFEKTTTDANTLDGIDSTGFVRTTRSINTQAPLTGGGDLSADRTIIAGTSSSSTAGVLSSTDWTTFNNKQNALGYTPVQNTVGSITGALGFYPVNNTNGTATGTQLTNVQINSGTGTFANATIDSIGSPFMKQTNGTATGAILNNTTFTGTTNGLNALTKWVAGGNEGTGTQGLSAGAGITISSTYNANGAGTITVSSSGTSSAGGWNDTGATVVQDTATDIVRVDNISILAGTGTLSAVNVTGNGTITSLSSTNGTITNLSGTNGTLTGTFRATTLYGDGANLTGISTTGTNTFELIQMPGTTTTPGFNDNWQWFAKLVPGRTSGSTTDELMLHCNNLNTTFIDDSEVAAVITANGNVTGTSTNAKFGAGASYYDGVTDYLSMPNSASYQVAGDFIVDCWVNSALSGGDSIYPIFSTQNTGTSFKGLAIYINRAAKTITIVAGDSTDTSNNLINVTTTGTLTANTTQHVYITAVGNNLYTYIDGVSAGTGSRTSGTIPNGSITVGYRAASASSYLGYMDEIRFAVGASGYTTNFTPPDQPYGPIYNAQHYYLLAPKGIGTATMNFVRPGTATTEKSYCFINATTTVFGSSTIPTATVTGYLGIGAQNAGGLLFDSFNTYSTKEIKTILGEVVGTKSDFIDALKVLKVAEWSPKIGKKVELFEAENQAKEDYIRNHFTKWREANKASYTSLINTGTQTITRIDEQRLETDYRNAIEIQWASDLIQYELIQSTKETLETNTTIKKLTPIANDPTTPEIIRTKDGLGLNLENQIGLSLAAVKQLIGLCERQQKEINDLKTRLQAAGIP